MTYQTATFDAAAALASKLAEIDAWSKRCDEISAPRTRAWKIVNRVMPRVANVPHGFYQPADFADALTYSAARYDLFHAIKPRIAAKIATRAVA